MAVDHLIFNKLKWWQSNEAPLIGKHAEVKKSARNFYIFESSGSGFYAYPATDEDVKSGTIHGEIRSAKFYGTNTSTETHMVCIDPGGKYWYKVEDVTISGGVKPSLSACIKHLSHFFVQRRWLR